MRQLEIDSTTNLSHILSEIKTTEENGLELNTVPNQGTVLDNHLHRSIIEKVAREYKKEVVFSGASLEEAPEIESDDLGFVEGEDIVAKAPIEEVHKMIQPVGVVAKTTDLKKRKISLPSFLKNKLALIGGFLVILILVLGLGFYFLPSAQVDLTLSSDNKDGQVLATGDTKQSEVDVKNKILPMKAVEITKDGSDDMATTGKKTVGTSATGRVTITNRSSEKTFVAGTLISPVASSTLSFKLDSDVTIPASQWPLGSDGTAGVNVTAVSPGTDSNLAANTSFKIGSASTSEVSAKNDLAFSGGSSKQVTVASADDRDTLKKQIVDDLTAAAKKDLEKNKDSVVADSSFETEVVKEVYDPANVDSAADKLKATITIKFKTFVYNRTDLIQILVDSLEKSSKGFNVDTSASKVSLQQTEKTSDTRVKLIGKINAILHPEIDKKEFARQLAGKSLTDVASYLDKTGNISSYKVTTFPGFFKIFNRMPFSANKIEINLTDSQN